MQLRLAVGAVFAATVSLAQEIPKAHTWYLLRVKHSGLYLGNAGGAADRPRAAQVATTANAASPHLWKLVPAGGGWFRLQNRSGRYLDVDWAARGSNAPVGHFVRSDHEGGAAQLWRPIPVADGWHRLQVKHSSLFLDITWADKRAGAPAGQAGISTAAGGGAQLWQFVPAIAAPAPPPAPPRPPDRPEVPLEIHGVTTEAYGGGVRFRLGITQEVPVTIELTNDDTGKQRLHRASPKRISNSKRYLAEARITDLPQNTRHSYRIWASDGLTSKKVIVTGEFHTPVVLANPRQEPR